MAATLTPEFAAMNGRDKWETLVLNGLIGTNEPWIAALTATLRNETADRQSLSDRIDVLEDAAKNVLHYYDPEREDVARGVINELRAALHQEGS